MRSGRGWDLRALYARPEIQRVTNRPGDSRLLKDLWLCKPVNVALYRQRCNQTCDNESCLPRGACWNEKQTMSLEGPAFTSPGLLFLSISCSDSSTFILPLCSRASHERCMTTFWRNGGNSRKWPVGCCGSIADRFSFTMIASVRDRKFQSTHGIAGVAQRGFHPGKSYKFLVAI